MTSQRSDSTRVNRWCWMWHFAPVGASTSTNRMQWVYGPVWVRLPAKGSA